MKRSELKQLIKEVIEEIGIQEIEQIAKQGEKWDIKEKGIKVFFDITQMNKRAWFSKLGVKNPEGQTFFGNLIQVANKIKHGDLNGANHSGFILSNGKIIDATTDYGVAIRDGSEIVRNPQNFVIFNIGGDENVLLARFGKLKKYIQVKRTEKGSFDKTKSYDMGGIKRQAKDILSKFPVINYLTNRIIKAEETDNDQFYCSELVANLLVQSGVLSLQDLGAPAKINEELSDLDKYDEIDPSSLFKLVAARSNLLSHT